MAETGASLGPQKRKHSDTNIAITGDDGREVDWNKESGKRYLAQKIVGARLRAGGDENGAICIPTNK